jgi:purine-nucleoside phosphorylase
MTSTFHETLNFLRQNGFGHPTVGIVLGTGLHELSKKIEVIASLDYAQIPHFPLSTVESHAGKLVYGTLNGKSVVAMQGRFHLYEGYEIEQVTYPIDIMSLLGIKTLLLSNAAGSINLSWKKGELMALTNHINFQNAFQKSEAHLTERANNIQPYDLEYIELLKTCASNLNIKLSIGTYVAVQGPNLETRAEYRFLRKIGADAVGMSTVPEVIFARKNNIRCVAISVLTDECDPDNLHPVSLAEIIAVAQKADQKLTDLYYNFVGKL